MHSGWQRQAQLCLRLHLLLCSHVRPVAPLPQFCVIFYIGGVLYCLLGFAVVCEEYFVASLLVLGDKFHLSDDVNGAPAPGPSLLPSTSRTTCAACLTPCGPRIVCSCGALQARR